MRLSRRSLTVAGFSLVGLAVVFAACTNDSTSPVGPQPPAPVPPTVPSGVLVVECRAELSTREVSCGDPATGGASAVMIGNQNVYVRLTTTNVEVKPVVSPDSLLFDLTVQNLLRQPVDGRKQNFGTTDGTTLDPAGVRVFFHQAPVANVGNVDVVNPTGQAIFTGSNQDYFQYNQVLDSGVVSAPYSEKWKLHFQNGATSATWLLMIATEVPLPNGWVDILPESTSVYVDSTATVTATVRSFVGNVLGGSVTYASNNPAIASIHPTTGVITGEAIGQTTITATEGSRTGSAVVIVPSTPPVIDPDSMSALENVTTSVDSANGLYPNIEDLEGDADIVPAIVTTPEGGTARIYANGSYDYLNAAGYTGKDTIIYEVDDGSNTVEGRVVVQVEPSNYWYVQQGGTGDGRDRFPFGSVADAQAAANGPGANDSIFVLYAGVTQLDGPAVLEDGQALIGQGITGDIVRTFNTLPVLVLADSLAPGITRSTAGATVTLAQNNIVAGLGVASGNGAAILGTNFASFNTHSITLAATGGAALDLTTGTLNGTVTTLSSTSSAIRGLYLVTVNGSLNATGGSITGAAGSAVQIVGGTVSVSYGGNVTQGNNAPLVTVGGGHNGTLTFSGTLNATNGTGLQLGNADGTYNFTGTTTLNGGDAGIDVMTGSDGTYSFGSNTSITNPTGIALSVFESAPADLSYAGTISTNASRPVAVDGASPCGTVTVSGNITSTGLGILVQDCSAGTVTFSGASKSLTTGANQAVTLATNTGASIVFSGGGLAISTTSGTGLGATGGGTLQVTGANNTVSTTTGTGVSLSGITSGASGITLRSVSVNGAANGIALSNITGNGFQVTGDGSTNGSGGTIQNTTGHAVTLATVVTTSLSFLNVTGAGASGNAGIFGSSFGTLTVDNVTVGATGGPALSTSTGTINGDFNSLSSASSASNGVILTTIAGSFTAGGGNITGAAATQFAVAGGSVDVTYPGGIATATNTALVAVSGGHNGDLVFNTGTLNATNGTGLQFDNADGTYQFNGTTTLNGGDAGIDMLNGSDGDFTFGTGVAITNPSGTGVFTSGSAPDVTYSGSISKNSAGWLVDTFNQSGGTITFQTGNLSATASSTGITFNNADGTVNFNGPTALSGGTARINVQGGSSGDINFASGTSVSGPPVGVGALHVTNGGASTNIDYAGTLAGNPGRPAHIEGVSGGTVNVTGAITSTGQGLLLQSNSGGTITFSSATKTFNTGANAAVTSTGTGASVVFSGGNLDIDATSGAGFSFSGGGSVQVTGTNNTVNTTGGGTAVNISGTSIGAGGVTFVRVDATGGGTNGIVLSNAGSGGFQVTGDGASDLGNTTRGRTTARAGGGSIVLGSGGTISGKSGDGVSLATTGAVTLRNMVVQSGSADGIDANATSGGLVVDNVQVTGHTNNRGLIATSLSPLKLFHVEFTGNATSASAGASAFGNVQLENVTGTDSLMSSLLTNGHAFVLKVSNSSGTLDLRVENTQVTGATAGIAAGVYPAGSSNVTANFQNDSVGHSSARGIQVGSGVGSSAVTNVTVNNTALRNNFVGVDLAQGAGGAFTFNITNNRLQTNVASSAQAINVNRLGSGSFTAFGLYSGTVSGNTIGTAGVPNSGSDVGDGINVESNGSGGTTRVAVLNNTIREIGQRGIYLAAVDTDIGGGAAPVYHARVQNNTITNFEAVALDGIQVTLGALSSDNPVMCFNITGNTVTTAPRNGVRMRTSGLPASTPTLTLQGWDGVTAVATFLASQNPAAAGSVANTNYSLGGGTDDPGACTTP